MFAQRSCLGAVGAVLVLVGGALLLAAWLFMQAVAAAGSEWLAGLPTIGFWASVKIWVFAVPLMFISILRPQHVRARVTGTSPKTETHDEW